MWKVIIDDLEDIKWSMTWEPLSAALLSISFQIECCRDDVKPSEE